MIRNGYTVWLVTLIVFLAICSGACKSKKPLVAEGRFEELNTKFERLFIEACTQYNIGNYAVALSQLNKCADIRPDEASVFFQISKTKQKLKEDNSAFQNASKANTIAPANKFYAAHYAMLLKNVGDYNKAIDVLGISINSNLKDEGMYNRMDDIYEIQNETDKRIALWLRYRENVGFKTSIGLKLAALYKLKKDYTSAHAIYVELKRAAPNKIQYYIEDAKLYEEQNDILNANLNYEKAIEINPNNWDVNYALYQFYAKKNDLIKAENYLRFAFEKSAVGFETKIPACQQLLKQVRIDSLKCNFALIAANGLVRNYGMDAMALSTAAELYVNCRRYEDAFQNYEKACGINPNLFDAWIGAMNCGLILKKYEKTIQIGERAIEYFPNTALLYENLAKAYNLYEQYDKAFEFADRGENLAFDDEVKSKLNLQKGISLYHQKKYSEALQIIEYAITINKGDAEFYDVLGNIHYFLKDENKAVENWQKAKNMGSRNDMIDKKINGRRVYE